jgi:outer membrane protein TolC
LGARLKNDTLELEQVLEIQRILSEVRDAQSMVRQAEQRQVPALESLRLALELEKAERVKFSLGDSTLFLVNQRERNTMSEALKVVEIWADGLKGQVMLEASAGRL